MTTRSPSGEQDVLTAATEDQDSVVELTRALVAIPSRGGIDPYEPALDHVATWLAAHGLPAAILRDSTGAAIGVTWEVVGALPGPRWVLDACLDTAPYGPSSPAPTLPATSPA